MRNFVLGLVVATGAMTVLIAAQTKINPTDPQPTCNMCPATYIPAEELQAYTKKAIEEKLVDQQVRSIDIGKSRIGIGIEYRTKLDKPGAADAQDRQYQAKRQQQRQQQAALQGCAVRGHAQRRIR